VFKTSILLLLCSGWATAACGTHRVEYYQLRLSQNRSAEALRSVLEDLGATAEERKAFKILTPTGDDTEQTLAISPAILQSGKSATCQYIASLLTRRHEKERDQHALTTYHQDWVAAKTGWIGCETEGVDLENPAEAAKLAYRCLEDPSLGIHQSGIAIQALMAKVPVADVPRLSDEDTSELQQQLRFFQEGWAVLDDKSTDSYYLPEIKRSDRQSFCRAVSYTRRTLGLKNEETSSWQHSCHQLGLEKK
jgi:hypothetical protein